MTFSTGSRPDELWAITSYFNPMRYQRRLSNFRTFRAHLNVPLVAVELAYDSDFELQDGDADILIRLHGGAVLWQKERLLNVGLRALPRECSKVAWLDCDIVFASPDWSKSAETLLDRYPVIQPFRNVHYLGPNWVSGADVEGHVDFTQPSSTSCIGPDSPAAMILGRRHGSRKLSYAPGLAWAARREILDRHSFYDLAIIGGGDRAMACAMHRCFEELAQLHFMNEAQRRMYLAWAEPFYGTVRAQTSFLDTDIFHLWHGDYPLRGTRHRFEGLQRFHFDPYKDIALEDNGAWRWNSEKHEMHEFFRAYFASRRDDDISPS
jgi:hypothetical protein